MTDIITLNGKKYKLVLIDFPEYEGTVYGLKPLKEAEKKQYTLLFFSGTDKNIVTEYLTLTPNTAKKVAEAFDAMVEGIQDPLMQDFPNDLATKFNEARKAYRDDQ